MLLLVTPISGCAVAIDFFNPQLFQTFGVDTTTVTGQPGVIIIALNNTTPADATFRYFYTTQTNDPGTAAQTTRNSGAEVLAGEVINEVIDCPVGRVSPGTLLADLSRDTVAAQVLDVSGEGTELVDVEYTGPALSSGVAYGCGDVIEIRLSREGAADAIQYRIDLRVIPGR
jgi:hypothetical protein